MIMNRAFPSKNKHRESGVSLVELSIVILIIGMLVGAVITGQQIMKASEMRVIISERDAVLSAATAFKDKYRALPGDMRNATTYWGAQDATASTCRTATSTTKLTCNGNGNGMLEETTTSGNEVFRFWQHLSNSGMYEGVYSGIAEGSTDFSAVAGKNTPISKISGATWHTTYINATTSYFNLEYGNVIVFGANRANDFPKQPIFRPDEMQAIDLKIDDGMPAKGKIIAFPHSSCTDSGGWSDLDGEYRKVDTLECVLIHRQAF